MWRASRLATYRPGFEPSAHFPLYVHLLGGGPGGRSWSENSKGWPLVAWASPDFLLCFFSFTCQQQTHLLVVMATNDHSSCANKSLPDKTLFPMFPWLFCLFYFLCFRQKEKKKIYRFRLFFTCGSRVEWRHWHYLIWKQTFSNKKQKQKRSGSVCHLYRAPYMFCFTFKLLFFLFKNNSERKKTEKSNISNLHESSSEGASSFWP